ncbi:MAG: hydroxymethylbilane synthase [Puniceicoccales bacterium]|jgi:hydroxymethylbilane synthase|nr:hydroxymethylbilane synthase [Puniceicoccales bacterium]
MIPDSCILLTRGSPLARRQTDLVSQAIREKFPRCSLKTEVLVTTGDKQLEWSLEKTGGKGLFTSELENALLAGRGDIAVHSAKDLPTEIPAGLNIIGYLPRANASDMLVRRENVETPKVIATGSPRRRTQARPYFPNVTFTELRGNVETRLKKIAAGDADASFLAAAGLARLGIHDWPGLVFEKWGLEKMVPAAGQAAIALQIRAADADFFAPICDAATGRAVLIERTFLARLGEGCHTAFAVHYRNGEVHIFREDFGRKAFAFDETICGDVAKLTAQVDAIIATLMRS